MSVFLGSKRIAGERSCRLAGDRFWSRCLGERSGLIWRILMFDGFFLNEGIVVVFLLEEKFYRLGCLGRFFDDSNFIGYKLD